MKTRKTDERKRRNWRRKMKGTTRHEEAERERDIYIYIYIEEKVG